MADVKDMATTDSGGELVIPADAFAGGLMVEGQGAEPKLMQLRLCAGTPEEDAKYGGKFRRGEFLAYPELRKIENPQIMPIAGYTTWSRWERGQRVPVYSYRDRRQVPPADLEWPEGGKPAAVECVHLIVAVRGEAWPYILRFKSTGLAAYKDIIQVMESARAVAGRYPGVYALSAEPDKNKAGEAYLRLKANPVEGNPTPEMLRLGIAVRKARAAMMEAAAKAEADDDAAPF